MRRQSSGFASRNKIAAARRPPLALRPLSLRSAVSVQSARRLVIAVKAAMGDLLGHAVRFGVVHDVMAAGEGIETMLSLRSVLPTMPMVAALSANHLAAILFAGTLRRLYVARDRDPAGDIAMATLTERARASGIEAIGLSPRRGDFNEDLRHLGLDDLRATLRVQLVPEDVARFMIATEEAEMRA